MELLRVSGFRFAVTRLAVCRLTFRGLRYRIGRGRWSGCFGYARWRRYWRGYVGGTCRLGRVLRLWSFVVLPAENIQARRQ